MKIKDYLTENHSYSISETSNMVNEEKIIEAEEMDSKEWQSQRDRA